MQNLSNILYKIQFDNNNIPIKAIRIKEPAQGKKTGYYCGVILDKKEYLREAYLKAPTQKEALEKAVFEFSAHIQN